MTGCHSPLSHYYGHENCLFFCFTVKQSLNQLQFPAFEQFPLFEHFLQPISVHFGGQVFDEKGILADFSKRMLQNPGLYLLDSIR